jgi:hypothetical protein
MNEIRLRLWERRLASLGAAQSRYLWLLLILGLFFLSLKSSLEQPTATLPGISIEIETAILEAASPSVLFLLVIVVHGSLRAYGAAAQEWRKEAGLHQLPRDEDVRLAEALDPVPNALDLAVFTMRRFEASIYSLLLFVYPLYLSIFTYEGVRLWCRLLKNIYWFPAGRFFAIVGAGLGLIASIQVLVLWYSRARMVFRQFKQEPAG